MPPTLTGLDGIVQGAKADIADGGLIVGDGGHDAVGAGLDGSGLGGVVDLLAVGVLFLHAGQLDKSTAGAGTVLTGDDGDVLVGVEVSSGFALGRGGLAGSSLGRGSALRSSGGGIGGGAAARRQGSSS